MAKGGMQGRMAGNGSPQRPYKRGLSNARGRVRAVSQPKPYKTRLGRAGEG